MHDGAGTPAQAISIGESHGPAHHGPPQHRHARHDEGFYVVSGTARFTVGDTVYDAPAGTLVMAPPSAPHTFANPAGATTVLLTPSPRTCTCLRDMIPAGRPLTAEATAEAMSRYATEQASDFA